MTTAGLEVDENHAGTFAGNDGCADQKSWQLHQGLGPTATLTSDSRPMRPDVDTTPLDHPQKLKKKNFLARLLSCCCLCTGSVTPATQTQDPNHTGHAVTPYGAGCCRPATDNSSSADPAQPDTPVSTQSSQIPASLAKYVAKKHSSGHRAPWDQGQQQQQQQGAFVATRRTLSTAVSEAPTEWTDAKSCFSNDLDGSDQDDLDGFEDNLNQLRQHQGSGQLSICRSVSFKAPWVPEPPLHFAERPLHFVPVPAVTGFAAYWANIAERTTPFPQPIDLMIKANWIVKKVHKSIPGLWIRETDKKLTVTGNPSFVPPGHRAYCEVYDKSNETQPTWSPRRDMQLGHNSGQIYFTADGMMILRTRAWSWPGNKMQYITEDYARLEDDGQVIVNKMWCLDVDTGNSASQYMVGSRHEHPPKHWV